MKINEKTQKFNSKHFSGGERARRAGIFYEKNQNLSRFWDLVGACMKFSPVSRFFLAGQQSKLTEKFKNLALNMFLVVNDPEQQEFSLKKSKFQQILGSGWRLHGTLQFSNFFWLFNNQN
jgi:hypothetical protein